MLVKTKINLSRIRLCLTVGLLLVLAVTSFATAIEPPDPFLKDLEAVDKGALHAAKVGLENYLGTRPIAPKWTIRVDEQNGVIETDWYRDHKGEVKLKAQIVVWGPHFRVDVWQDVGWLFPSLKKTDWSRRTERHIQESIEKELSGVKH